MVQAPLTSERSENDATTVGQGAAPNPGLIAFVVKSTPREQATIVAVSALALPIYYATLDLAKWIVNEALAFEPTHFPHVIAVAGWEIAAVGQTTLLVLYCAGLLAANGLHGLIKRFLNVYQALAGEKVLLRMRRALCHGMLADEAEGRVPPTVSGRTISIVTAELEPLSGFVASAVATPVFELGMLVTAYVFIFQQNVAIGLALLVLYPVQLSIVPRLQERQTRLEALRVEQTRDLGDLVGALASRAQAGRASTASKQMDALAERIFATRRSYYRVKFTINFLLNFFGHAVTSLIYLVAGLFVIRGELSIGSLVAIAASHKDLVPSWKELLDYRQEYRSSEVKLGQILDGLDQTPDILKTVIAQQRST